MEENKDLELSAYAKDTPDTQAIMEEPEKENKPKPKSRPKSQSKPTLEAAVETVIPTFIDPKEARKRDLKDKINREREEKAQMVTGKFLFNECPGGELKFCYREYPGDQLVHYTMKHDNIYTIPLGVARHLNDRCAYYEYQHNIDGGKTVDAKNMYIQSKVHRTSFIPLNFTTQAGNYSGNSIAKVTFTDPLKGDHLFDAMGR